MDRGDRVGHASNDVPETRVLMDNGSTQKDNQAITNNMPFIMMMLQRRLQYLPVITAVLIISSFFISYVVSVSYGHVEPDFPYISYAAIHAPERCIFAQMVNFGAFMLATNIYIRYKQMAEVLKLLNATPRYTKMNTTALWLGLISAFGLTMVANFQTVVMRPAHYTGAFTAFCVGTAYCWLQTILSIRYRRWSSVAVGQLVNSIILTVCLIIFCISKALYKIAQRQGRGTKWDSLRGVYLTSTVSEWLTAISLTTFALTFYKDFSRISLYSPTVRIMDDSAVLEDYRFGALHASNSAASDSAIPMEGQNGHSNQLSNA